MEDLPDFHEAISRFRTFIKEQLYLDKPLIWIFREDLISIGKPCLIRISQTQTNAGLVKELYDHTKGFNGGLTMECQYVVEDRPCCNLLLADDEAPAGRLMIPPRGLKLSVADSPRRAVRARW